MTKGVAAAAALGLVTAVAGCAGTDGFMASTQAGPSLTSKVGDMLAFGSTDTKPVLAKASRDAPLQCPQIEVLDGTASVRNYGSTGQTNDSVKFQYSMGDVARECTRAGDQIMIKVGVEGRVLLGPVGQPGSFNVPIRIAVRRESDQKPAVGKLYQVPASVAFGQTQGDFALVSEPLAVPYVQAHADEDYTILVGFDDKGATSDAKPAAKRKRRGAPG